MNVESFIKKLKESEEYREFVEEIALDEMSTTASVPGYQTPNAFSPSEKEFEKHSKESAETQGYTVVPKKSKKNFESIYKQAMNVINEGTYNEFRKDETRSSNRKINDSIKNINRTIYEVERVVEHALRLKTEMNVDQRTLWGESMNRLRKISERINRITKKIHELGA
jgi:flagellar biosynthesis component FlhA